MRWQAIFGIIILNSSQASPAAGTFSFHGDKLKLRYTNKTMAYQLFTPCGLNAL